RPYIGTRGDAHVESDFCAAICDDVERVHLRASHGHVHLHPAPGQPVGALTADLHRRGGRDRQLDGPAEVREPQLELGTLRPWMTLSELALRVAGRGPCGQVDIREVALVQSEKAWSESSCPSGQQE